MQLVNRLAWGVISYIEHNLSVVVTLLFFVSLALRLIFNSDNFILREDSYTYFLKSLEIIKGDFTPVLSHEIGLSLIAAPIFALFGSHSIFEKMIIAEIFSAVVGTLVILPVYYLCKQLKLPDIAIFLVILVFSFYPALIIMSDRFLTESLFTLVFLSAIYFVLKSQDNPKSILFSFSLASIAWWLRPNGLLVFFVVLISGALINIKNFKNIAKVLIIGILVFVVLSLPVILLRIETFGVFTYGENDKLFVENYEMVWSGNIKAPGFLEYLSTHNIGQILNKFVVHGLMQILVDMFVSAGSLSMDAIVLPVMSVFLIYGFISRLRDIRYLPLYTGLVIFALGLSLVYSVFRSQRYMFPLIPILLIFVTASVYEISRKMKFREFFILAYALCVVTFSAYPLIVTYRNVKAETMPCWAKWAAENLSGKIAIIEGGDLIMMQFQDVRVGGISQTELFSSHHNISVTRPGYYQSLSDALIDFKNQNISYVALDSYNISRRPYLKEIYINSEINYFEKIYSSSGCSNWNMEIFKIKYYNYDKVAH